MYYAPRCYLVRVIFKLQLSSNNNKMKVFRNLFLMPKANVYIQNLYFYLEQTNPNQLKYITDVKVFKIWKTVTIEVTTNEPGLFIGKAGRCIDELKEIINNDTDFKYAVKIAVKENRVFSKIW